MLNFFRSAALTCALVTMPAFAQDYVVEVNGIVCQFCSLGVAKKVSKLPFIDRSKYDKGVLVEAEAQKVVIAVKADAMLDRDALFTAILDGGYEPVQVFERLSDGQHRVWVP